MTTPDSEGTLTVTINAGAAARTMAVHPPTPEQLIITQMELALLDGTDDMQAAVKSGARIIRTVLSMISSQDDRDWVIDRMAEGMLTLEQFQSALKEVTAAGTSTPTAKPKLKPRGRSGK